MASAALAQFNTAVDALGISAARKADVKRVGARLYIAGSRETIAHLRKHMAAVAGDAGETAERRAYAAAMRDLVDGMTHGDSWWLDIQELL